MKSIKKKMFSYILKRTKKNYSNSTRPDDYAILEEEEMNKIEEIKKEKEIKPTINELLSIENTGLFIQQNPDYLGRTLENYIFTGYLFKGIPIGIGILSSTKYHGTM